jgi:large subunit ribosomal protein L18
VYKSNTATYAQLIDDENAVTLAAASSMEVKGNKTTSARAVGVEIAKLAQAKNIAKVVFDRGGFIYTGRIKALADGAREGGLQF